MLRIQRSGIESCCGNKGSRIGYTPVPYVMRLQRTAEGEPAFLEKVQPPPWPLLAIAAVPMLMSVIPLLMVIEGIMDPTRPFPWLAAVYLALALGLAILILVVTLSLRPFGRRLVLSEGNSRLSIQVIDRDGTVTREWADTIDHCRLTMHPVSLWTQGGMRFHFTGWMARVIVKERCFTLACCKERGEVESYIRELPDPLRMIWAGEGTLVEGAMADRWLSNVPVRI